MEVGTVKRFLDACHRAKRVVELMPRLPEGMTPRHVHVIDVISQLQRRDGRVRVGDVSEHLGITRPSVTRLVGELERLGAVRKLPDPRDGRVTLVELTELGSSYEEDYFEPYARRIAERLGDLPPERVEAAIDVMERFYAAASAGETGQGAS